MSDTVYNTPVGGVEIIKVNADDHAQRIPNVTFEVRRVSDGGLIDTVTTGSDGRVYLPLETGNYYAVEIKCPKEFKLDDTPHYFTVKDGKSTTLTVENKAFCGILIHKTDSVTGKGIYGVNFLLYNASYTPIGQYASDNEGYVYIEGLTVGGRYYLRELENPGYVPDTQLKTVYHDLKHQLEDLRGSVHDDGQKLLIDHIESELKEYSPQLDTGNAVLNALLDSRRVLCQRKGITVTAVADGRLLSFLSTADLCTIIGNALDNAVECVSEIEDPQKRLIHLEVTSNKGFVLIRVENPVEQPVHFAGGLPRSGKAITTGHGLGTRSIQRTVNKLGGNAVFGCVNDSFVLRIIFPVSRFSSL